MPIPTKPLHFTQTGARHAVKQASPAPGVAAVGLASIIAPALPATGVINSSPKEIDYSGIAALKIKVDESWAEPVRKAGRLFNEALDKAVMTALKFNSAAGKVQ
jgi:hypothetical protein